LSQKQGALQAILAKVASLKQKLQAAQTEKARLEAQADKTKTQLTRAEKLVSSLGDEKGRWNSVGTSYT
jgi:dynein heavy chain